MLRIKDKQVPKKMQEITIEGKSGRSSICRWIDDVKGQNKGAFLRIDRGKSNGVTKNIGEV